MFFNSWVNVLDACPYNCYVFASVSVSYSDFFSRNYFVFFSFLRKFPVGRRNFTSKSGNSESANLPGFVELEWTDLREHKSKTKNIQFHLAPQSSQKPFYEHEIYIQKRKCVSFYRLFDMICFLREKKKTLKLFFGSL